jgi:hypothetical protein
MTRRSPSIRCSVCASEVKKECVDGAETSRNHQGMTRDDNIVRFPRSKLIATALVHVLLPLSVSAFSLNAATPRSPVHAFLSGPSGLQHPSAITNRRLFPGIPSHGQRTLGGPSLHDGRRLLAASGRRPSISMNVGGTLARQAEVRTWPKLVA